MSRAGLAAVAACLAGLLRTADGLSAASSAPALSAAEPVQGHRTGSIQIAARPEPDRASLPAGKPSPSTATATATATATDGGGAQGGAFFPVEQAVAGLQGVAKTVFRGDRIEEFPLEIIGRLRNFTGPGQDVILARLLGEQSALTGVPGGMSGSPVYIEGRLLGALSYRIGSFTKEPIAGITPIGDMLRATEFPAASIGALHPPGEGFGLVPIGTPVFLGGFTADVVDRFAPRLRRLGLEPVRAGTMSGGAVVPTLDGGMSGTAVGGPVVSAGASSSRAAGSAGSIFEARTRALRPGDPIAAVLVAGDLSVAAAGTLTYIDGNRLYAFGHPFLQTGSIEIPAARATILWTLSSWLASNKLAEIGPTVGAIREDRLTAVVGEIGSAPRMIPITVDVESVGGPPRRYSFEVARAKGLVPLLVNLTLSSALTSSVEFSMESTGMLEATIDVAGYGPIRVEDALVGDASAPVGMTAAARIADVVGKIYENPFRDADLDRVTVRLRQAPRLTASTVDRAVFSSDEIEPGAPFEVRLHLRNFRGEPSIETAVLSLPPGTLPGPVLLLVGDERAVEASSGDVSIGHRLLGARDYRSYLDSLADVPRGGWLTLRLVRPARGASVRSQSMPDLPPSILALLQSRRGPDSTGALAGTVLWERTLALEGPVAGVRGYPLRIGRAGRSAESRERP